MAKHSPKKAAPKKSASKSVRKPAKSAAKATAGRKSAAKKVAKKPPAKGSAGKPAARKKSAKVAGLGRPLVTAEADLDMVFKDDYHVRQVFEFLRVKTVRELEAFSPQQIVDRLSQPVVVSVERIRRKLAVLNRHLEGDLAGAVELKRHQQQN